MPNASPSLPDAHGPDFTDWLRFSCGGALSVWNRVGHLACGQEYGACVCGHEYGRLSLQYLALDAVSCDGSVTTVVGRQHVAARTSQHSKPMPSSTGARDDDLEAVGAVAGGFGEAPTLLQELLPPIFLLTVSETGSQGSAGAWPMRHECMPDAASRYSLHHPAPPTQPASHYMLKVVASVRASLKDGRVAQSTVVRNYSMVHGCFSGAALVSHLLLVNLAADRLHALHIAQQVPPSSFPPRRKGGG